MKITSLNRKKFPCSGSQLATGSSDPKFLNFQPEGERICVSWLKWCRGFSFSVCTLYTKVPIQLCQSHGKLKERAPEWLKQMFHNLEERPPSNQTMFAKSVPFCKLKLKSDLCNFCHLSHYQNHHSDPGPKWMVVGHVDVDVDVDDLSYWYLDFWVGRHISKPQTTEKCSLCSDAEWSLG